MNGNDNGDTIPAEQFATLEEIAATKVLPLVTADARRHGCASTPTRWAKAIAYILRGTRTTSTHVFGSQGQGVFEEDASGIVVIRPFLVAGYSHRDFSPLLGKAGFAYQPEGGLLGLSKVDRLLDMLTARPQDIETLTGEFAQAVHEDGRIGPQGVFAKLELRHVGAEILRGDLERVSIKKTESGTGCFKEQSGDWREYANILLKTTDAKEELPVARWSIDSGLLCPEDTLDELSDALSKALKIVVGGRSLIEPGQIPQTALRFARSLLAQSVGERLEDIPDVQGGTQQQVGDFTVCGRIPFSSACEHHVFPIEGEATVVVGGCSDGFDPALIPGIVFRAARRLTIQERLTQNIKDAVVTAGGRDVFVSTACRHLCKELRGVQNPIWRVHNDARAGRFDELREVIGLVPKLREAGLYPCPVDLPIFM